VRGLAPTATCRCDAATATVHIVPRYWIWLQVLAVVFVLAGMVIAITRLA
jgi:hypothetical protein